MLAVAAVTPLQVLAPLGLGTLAVAGGGAAIVGQMMNTRCPATRPCRVGCFSSLFSLVLLAPSGALVVIMV